MRAWFTTITTKILGTEQNMKNMEKWQKLWPYFLPLGMVFQFMYSGQELPF